MTKAKAKRDAHEPKPEQKFENKPGAEEAPPAQRWSNHPKHRGSPPPKRHRKHTVSEEKGIESDRQQAAADTEVIVKAPSRKAGGLFRKACSLAKNKDTGSKRL